jgi:outer membrane biosynthesis protein TonB
MATPFVSGSLGLLLAADPNATATEALAAIESSAGPQLTDTTAFGLVHLDAALTALLAVPRPTATPTVAPTATPSPDPTATPDPNATPPPEPTPTPTTVPTPTPTTGPAPVAAPAFVTRSASLTRVPRALVVVTRAGTSLLTLANPRRAYLVLTLKRGGILVWRRTTRASAIHWTIYVRTATYTLTVSRPGSHVATGTVFFRYRPR